MIVSILCALATLSIMMYMWDDILYWRCLVILSFLLLIFNY
jgi:hypothetical protein